MDIKHFLLILAILLLPIATAADLDVKLIQKDNILVTELQQKNATFKLEITNNDESDEFQIYSLVSVAMYPKEFFKINHGETITLDVTAVPFREILSEKKGIYAFEYQIKGKKTGFFKDNLALRIFDVKDIISTNIKDIPLNSTKVEMTIRNRENITINNLKITAKSNFFEFADTFNIKNNEDKVIQIPITLDRKISAGDYEAEITYELNSIKSSTTLPIRYLESSGISSYESSSGFIIKRTNITRSNEGNVPAVSVINIRKNILSRLFTVYSEKPTTSSRSGIFVDYSWEKEIGVGEVYSLYVTTNYTIPFIILLLIIVVGLLTRFVTLGKLSVHKGVSLVKTRGGELALKVNLRIKAKSDVKNVTLADRIPGHAKLFNKFGIQPHRINEASRKIEWDIPQLNAGEERLFSYIIYSKINIVGSFELPAANASFDSEGKRLNALSNKTHFAAETTEN
jgi:hypothetical protein